MEDGSELERSVSTTSPSPFRMNENTVTREPIESSTATPANAAVDVSDHDLLALFGAAPSQPSATTGEFSLPDQDDSSSSSSSSSDEGD
jgi:hypothetical protein